MCEILPSAGIAVDPTESHSAPLCSSHTEVVFSSEILSNNRKEEQREGAQSHQFVPLLLVVMATSLETKATASTDSQK